MTDDSFIPPGLRREIADNMAEALQGPVELGRPGSLIRAEQEARERAAQEKAETEKRERRLFVLAERAEERETRREGRERLNLWLAWFGLAFSLVAAITGLIALAR